MFLLYKVIHGHYERSKKSEMQNVKMEGRKKVGKKAEGWNGKGWEVRKKKEIKKTQSGGKEESKWR